MKPIINNNEISLNALFDFIFLYNKRILKISFFFVLLYILYFFALKSPKYSSEVSFYTDYSKSQSSILSPFLANISGEGSNLSFAISDYINSDQFLSSIVNKNFIIDNKEITLSELWGKNYNKYFSINPLSTIKIIDMNLKFSANLTEEEKKEIYAKSILRSKINFSENRVSGLNKISITIRNNPNLGKQIMDTSYISIISFYNQVTSTKAIEKREFIEGRIDKIGNDLKDHEDKLKVFLEQNKNVNSPLLELEKQRLERSINLLSQVYLNLYDQLELAKIDEYDNTSTIFVLDKASKSTSKIGMGLFDGAMYCFLLFYIVSLVSFLVINRRKVIN